MDDSVIKHLQFELDRLESLSSRAEKQWRDIEADRQAITRTIAILMRQSSRGTGTLNVTSDEIAGMTQERAVVYIAERNGGELRFSPAKKLLLDANLIGNPKNAATILYTMMQRSGRFEQERRGVYHLLSSESDESKEGPALRSLTGEHDDMARAEVVDDYRPGLHDVAG
jgi:hypothetical protein